ncbi:MAG: hypothetical protein GY731_14215 [Gammaproteobacteria bacterium]|nr:hypothetical protein [Gammaproteobacteria bacterium]
MNPEFLRNLWLELSPHRLAAMPLVLFMIFGFVYVSDSIWAGDSLAFTAIFLFVILAGIWGAKQAGESVLSEIQERTWDWQRMSGISPWAMAWGKLLGSTIFVWYGGFLCLLVFVGGSIQTRTGAWIMETASLLLGVALLVQSLALYASLLVIRQHRQLVPRRSSILYLLALMTMFPFFSFIEAGYYPTVYWYGIPFRLIDFVLFSLATFIFWTVLGIYRLMRAELQFRNQPWTWLLFVAYLMAYVSGFGEAGLTGRMMIGYFIALGLTLLMVLVEPKDPVVWRSLFHSLRNAAWRNSLEILPRWSLTLLLAVALACGLLAVTPELPRWFPPKLLQFNGFVLALLLFLIRDIGIILYLGLAERAKRPEFAAVIYLLLLYSVVPGILLSTNLGDWTVAFWPRPDVSIGTSIFPAMVEAAIMLILVAKRWRNRFTGLTNPQT